MKALPAIAAVAIALALVMSPMVANAAGSVTFTSPTSGASYKDTATVTVSGTISPAPTQADQMGITVKNPSGQTVDLENVAVSSGSFSTSFVTGGTSAWVSGTYTITALDSYGATGSITFSYTCSTCGITGSSTYQKDVLGNLSLIEQNQQTIMSNQQTIMSDLGTLTSAVNGINTAVGTLSTNVGTILSNINSLTSTVGQINTNVGTLSNQLPSAGTLSNTQTYVLVVAVIAAITLVLELAILVRRLS